MKILRKRISRNEIAQQVNESSSDFDSPSAVISSWKDNFEIKCEDQSLQVKGLRNPQVGALYAILSHWSLTNDIGTVVMPTGTGKTETMLSALIVAKISQLLVIVPTDPLRTQISNKFIKLGLLEELGLVTPNIKFPVVGIIKNKFLNVDDGKLFFQSCNVIVATASIISRLSVEIFNELKSSCSHLFIDEAHHSEAQTWCKFREALIGKRIIQFTATPFRNDCRKIDGKIIYNYPLKMAQQEGYFKPIKFIKVYEYSNAKKDKVISNRAIQQLREDRKKHPHILLARVGTTKRADEVFELYNVYDEFKVVKIHSRLTNPERQEAHKKIVNKEADIIVCVDMLGEGFDLPSLKIAAFHDIRKSLPVTLQFVGRFTRSQYDSELGDASIIANLADLEVKDELQELYAQDVDWNLLLPELSEQRTQKEVDFHKFIEGFKIKDDFPITINSLRPALSTVIFKNKTDGWFPTNFVKGIPALADYELVRHIINPEEQVLIIVTAKRQQADWVNNEFISDLTWNCYIVFWETKNNLLFIHSSDNGSLHIDLAKSIIGDKAELINGDNGGKVFRALSGINRFKLQNVGLIEVLGKLIRFVMRVGSDIEPALSKTQIQRAKKAMIFGAGYEFGEDVSIGCSYKGRIWSRRKSDIPTFLKWCTHIGNKVIDEGIDAEAVLKGALVSKSISTRPKLYPFYIDWGEELYNQTETRYSFSIGSETYYLYETSIVLVNPAETGNIRFGLEVAGKIIVELDLILFQKTTEYADFKFEKVSPSTPVMVNYGTKQSSIENYFYEDTPVIWFTNGDFLEGSNYIELKDLTQPFKQNDINSWDWEGIDLNVESQGVTPILTNSIQYKCIEVLKTKGFDVIYDDDGSGEIADIITVRKMVEVIEVELYHLKYAANGQVSGQIKNLYEVCGQAQKSVNWKFKGNKEFLEHLMRRKEKKEKSNSCSRFVHGTEEDIIGLIDLVNNKFPVSFKIIIVQPGISKSGVTNPQLTLLGVTESYLMERALIKLEVIGSA